MVSNLPKFKTKRFGLQFDKHVPLLFLLIIAIAVIYYLYNQRVAAMNSLVENLRTEIKTLSEEKEIGRSELQKIGTELEDLKNQDQLKKNNELQTEIKNIQDTYKKALVTYEDILSFRDKTKCS